LRMSSETVSTRSIIHPDFLLSSTRGREIFHGIAEGLPIVDFHCHVNPKDIAEDRAFEDLAEVWVVNDPYKHRAMRINGVPERLITGDAGNHEKYLQWAKTVPYTLGNPLFHWSALELKRFFGVEEMLDEATAQATWEKANGRLSEPGLRMRGLLTGLKVYYLVTSDLISSDLADHERIDSAETGFHVLPSVRIDEVASIADNPGERPAILDTLSEHTGVAVKNLASFREAVSKKLDHFDRLGCKLSDVALADFVFVEPEGRRAEAAFDRFLSGGTLSREDRVELRSAILLFLGEEYTKRNWVMQLHIGAQRQTSSRLRKLAGGAGGFAAIGTPTDIRQLVGLLNGLEKREALPRTILFNLNPTDSAAFASLTGSFVADGVPGKTQFGPAWWYNDHAEGIRDQLVTLSHFGLLPRFVGMTTDSRSPLSYIRHDYFRRIFSNLIGEWVDSGQLPDSDSLIERVVTDICYRNALQWVAE
jgi:glucuronate isomerase